MLIHSSSQLLTLANGPQRGKALGTLGIMENGAVVVRDEKIVAVGRTAELKASYPNEPTLDAGNCVLMPGFVDPHTHVIWAGDRAHEFEMKMAGKPYLEILAEGGGILSTVKQTRTASIESMIAHCRFKRESSIPKRKPSPISFDGQSNRTLLQSTALNPHSRTTTE